MKKIFWAILRWCAQQYLHKKKPYIIGVTWSIWKTTCRMIIAQVLQTSLPDLIIRTSEKNFNSEIWLALSILDVSSFSPSFFGSIKALILAFSHVFTWPKVDVLVLEYWIDWPGDMDVLLEIAIPDSAIFTGLDKVHSTHFVSVDDILEEKVKLLIATKDVVFLPWNTTVIARYMERISADVLTYGLKQDTKNDIWFTWYELFQDAWWRILTRFHSQQENEEISLYETTVVWEISAWYVSLGSEIAMIVWRRLTAEVISPDFLEIASQNWRNTMFEWIEWSVLIDSTYNAAPKSMSHMVNETIKLRNTMFPEYQFIYCLWDMNELGEFAQEEHRKLASQISQSAEAIFLIGEHTHTYTYDELKKIWSTMSRVFLCDDAHHLWRELESFLIESPEQYIVLFKASQWGLYLEEALPYVMLHQDDCSRLCRQDDRWRRKKKVLV